VTIDKAPDDLFVTYVLKADRNGVFNFSCPVEGWWGFAALTNADYTIKGPDGKEKPVETGAVIWIEVTEWQVRKDGKNR
jgi:cobalt/nickel transport protein